MRRGVVSHGYHDTDDLTDRIGDWFRSPLGQSVWAAETAITDQLISRLLAITFSKLAVMRSFLSSPTVR